MLNSGIAELMMSAAPISYSETPVFADGLTRMIYFAVKASFANSGTQPVPNMVSLVAGQCAVLARA